MKRILDTVHGYIMVDEHFIDHIIDSPYFQRLRRIEQTSIRSVYPSARHDRFIHSLGVYHIGSMIVDHLKKEGKDNDYWGQTENTMGIIYDSYLAACLLHDVGHAPFSHSFESFFGHKKDLASRLKDIINNNDFNKDLDNAMKNDMPNYHELMSAIISYSKFKDALESMSINAEFVARMITGVFYLKRTKKNQVYNCFISLLHGNIIDADRLDYACRDVWASGYSTSSIDLRRLISALHIKKNSEDEYVVCFENNSLNEIEGVLNVKDFQVRYVINHHTVSYDQWLLRQAACKMALEYFPNIEQDRNGVLALGQIIKEESIIGKTMLPKNDLSISNLSDDDLVFLMKQSPNSYYTEWSCRQYSHYPLWKSRDEFFHYFNIENPNMLIEKSRFEQMIKDALVDKVKNIEDIIITQAIFKPRVKMTSLYILVAGHVVRYTDIYPDKEDNNKDLIFYYVFLPKENMERREISQTKVEIIRKLKPSIDSMYKKD